jgi:cell wall-associated NlpC family hydrolase
MFLTTGNGKEKGAHMKTRKTSLPHQWVIRIIVLVTCTAMLFLSSVGSPGVSSGATTRPVDGMATFRTLVNTDKGLTAAEKDRWIRLAGSTFEGKSFSFDYGKLVYGIFSQAAFDEVAMEKAAAVALSSATAVNRGAPVEEVSDLALLAFASHLTSDDIRLYAMTMKKCNDGGVPGHVTQEMIRHADEDSWTEHTVTTIMDGLVQAAREKLATEKTALYMLISVAQKMGTPERIVQDALADGRKRASAAPSRAPSTAAVPSRRMKQPRIALDYDNFRASVESFLGTPYVWGGNTRAGVDCSGFTRLVLGENGYQIPRVSRDQAKVGTPVNKDRLKLGDLIFFDTKGYGRITHVGIYLGGNLLVHASSSKGVTIVLFSNRYFQSRYVSARRIVRYGASR